MMARAVRDGDGGEEVYQNATPTLQASDRVDTATFRAAANIAKARAVAVGGGAKSERYASQFVPCEFEATSTFWFTGLTKINFQVA